VGAREVLLCSGFELLPAAHCRRWQRAALTGNALAWVPKRALEGGHELRLGKPQPHRGASPSLRRRLWAGHRRDSGRREGR